MMIELSGLKQESLEKIKESSERIEIPEKMRGAPEPNSIPVWEKQSIGDLYPVEKNEMSSWETSKREIPSEMRESPKPGSILPWDTGTSVLPLERPFPPKESSSETTEKRLPKNGGDWTGEPGDSKWKPDRDKVPENQKTNPDGLTWGEILDKYNIDGISFKDGEPDFSELSKGTVEIEDYSENRDDNFDAADEKLAEQRGCTKEEVRQWRKENHYTWHERSDMKTMEKVPTEVHGNIPHEGGIAAKKKENENG